MKVACSAERESGSVQQSLTVQTLGYIQGPQTTQFSRKTCVLFVHTPQHSNTTAAELHLFRKIRSLREEKPLNGGKKSFFRLDNHKIQPNQPRKQTFRTPRLHTSLSNHLGPTIEPFQYPAVTLVHRDELPGPVPCARLDRRATRTAE